MVRIIIFAALISVALMIYTLIECARTERHRVRSLPKTAWIVIVILLPLIGPGLWFVLGRPQSGSRKPPETQNAPDDDEDFLRQLEIWRRQQQRETELKAREEELKRKEREAKKPKKDNSSDDSDTPSKDS
ncbi:PLD nuclease N-terminal domain-containing protein [Glutamicibacter arilaitensis]|uniref:PLD nuclease N-terminal domain-containing protein n=1 Tax=Glutamicibacter arilaitensis TaxID=256701 RepID=UPI00384C62CB